MHATQIALIDDDRSWLEALAEYLQTKGFSVRTAVNPAEGLALVNRNNISVVVCDYDMPGMSGLELVRSICQQPRNIAVLMVSNEEEPSLAGRALAAGARGFLPKTSPPTQLVRKLRQILADLDAVAQPSSLHLWQRLLPSPYKGKSGRSKNRPAARSRRVRTTKASKLG
jgi:DNA-binding NarL/FixJ family response regulator